MLRYIHRLQARDLSLTTSMIPLGSCTMKLNGDLRDAARHLARARASCTRSRPPTRRKGYAELFAQLEAWLAEITGFAAMSLQPNAGSQGEYAGLLVIRAYHHSRGDTQRDVCLIPVSAHGTNPASAVTAGFKVVVVACDDKGNIDVEDLRRKAPEHRDRLGALMVTYPSTYGVFEETIREVCAIVHEHGGQVYMDGANMNAQVGLTRPGGHRRRRVPPEPAQDLLHPARRRRPRHGADRRGRAPRPVPARPSGDGARHRAVGGRGLRGALRQPRASWSSRGCTSRSWVRPDSSGRARSPS